MSQHIKAVFINCFRAHTKVANSPNQGNRTWKAIICLKHVRWNAIFVIIEHADARNIKNGYYLLTIECCFMELRISPMNAIIYVNVSIY